MNTQTPRTNILSGQIRCSPITPEAAGEQAQTYSPTLEAIEREAREREDAIDCLRLCEAGEFYTARLLYGTDLCEPIIAELLLKLKGRDAKRMQRLAEVNLDLSTALAVIG